MVRMDWDRILAIKAESLTDDEIEDLFPMVIRCDVDDIEDVNNLRAIMKLSQEMLQHKDNQVESLLLECDELKEKVSSAQPVPVKRQKKPIIHEIVTSDDIERDDEIKPGVSMSEHYRDTMNTTNDKIKTLLQELESLEEENDTLKQKLEILKEEMEDATENMDEITEELEQLRKENNSHKEEIEELQRENEAMTTELEELKKEFSERGKTRDDFSSVIDEKVNEWKIKVKERDSEISRLKEELSEALAQSMRSLNEENKAEIILLNEEIEEGKKIIVDLQEKLLIAASELNESAAVIEKLKNDAKRLNKTGRRKEQRDLLKKVQEANERISRLQDSLRQAENESTLKSEQLCQVLIDLKKFEDRDRGLAETIKEARELKEKLSSKQNQVKELINVINNLEMLNSCREMQILALREKLGIPEDEEISIDHIALKSQEDARLRHELTKKNEALERQNFEMKSDIRTLRYKLNKLGEKVSTSGHEFIDSVDAPRPRKKTKYRGIVDEEITTIRQRAEIDEMTDNVKIVIEENEALRRGMHEILDSIRDQDGKSEVEVHSEILERLLEALDVRHISGWYHPAMRLQERLNVVQGSNAELRSQLKQMRKELHRKDILLRKRFPNDDIPAEKLSSDDNEIEDSKTKGNERSENNRQELENCIEEKNSLKRENEELRENVEKMLARLEVFERDLQILESSEDEIKREFAEKIRENAESALLVVTMRRKCSTMENLLNLESTRNYEMRKDSINTENALRKFLADLEKRNEILSNELATLRSNLSNSVSSIEFNELREKYEENCIRLRTIYELKIAEKPTTMSGEDFSEKTDDMNSENENIVSRLKKVNSELQEQLVSLSKKFFGEVEISPREKKDDGKIESEKYEEKIRDLIIENKSLSRKLEISCEEIDMHSTANSLKIFELDNLRHQILDLHAISEDKETIARLGFELNICKSNEIELTKRKVQLENEILRLRDDLDTANKSVDETKTQLQDCRKICSNRCRSYEEVIDFLRCQYAGSTSLTSLSRFDAMLSSVVETRAEAEKQFQEANSLRESAKMHQDLLTDRLEIVERLRDVLEEQIGTSDLDTLMQSFSENSQYSLNEVRLKRRIAQLESELRSALEKSSEYKSTILEIELEMISAQRTWYKKPEVSTASTSVARSDQTRVETKTIFTEARVESKSTEVQCDLIDSTSKIQTPKIPEILPIEETNDEGKKEETIFVLKNQLDEALALASERAALLIKSESQIVEYRAKIQALEESIKEKNSQTSIPIAIPSERKESEDSSLESNENSALKSTIASLQKIISQKEETISRYQNLLKNDRVEHSNAAAQFQKEIKSLREEISNLRDVIERKSQMSSPAISRNEEPIRERKSDIEGEEKIARLQEKSSTLEAELNIARELGERWHRLAEERLQHMDHMRERLEEQHKNELESYRLESNKWQTEADTLRQQLSENRMQLAKGNISLVKELQERDNKIHKLTVAYQQLQSEFEMMETMTMAQPVVDHGNCTTKMQEMAQALGRDQANHFQTELDLLKRQIKSQNEKEKMYKDQIADLKQQISRGYMAKKTEERRISNREMQLERKLKTLEEELHKARTQLDREYRVQEAKRIKTAEELALWEKQKKWQQTAERLKKELRDRNEELKKLSANYEKLRSVVSCMEREKWYLRSKLRNENANVGLSPAANDIQYKIVENLQLECQTLRDRVRELTDRLESEESRQSAHQLEQQRRRIAALEAAAEGNTFVVDQLERLELAKGNLEKTNIRLESENFELRMELEKKNMETPRLREKVEHLEKYVELLKVEKTSESSSPSSEKNMLEPKKSSAELEKTVFILKRVVERLQAENKRLKENSRKGSQIKSGRTISLENGSPLKRQYELAQKRVVALETDLQLAEQRIIMLENARKEEDNAGEIGILRQQLAHKSELLDKVKQLLTRAAINEKALRQKIQQIELKQTLATIPECSPTN